MTKKRLVFYWYASRKYINDITYKLHLACFRHYFKMFDSGVFVISVDDLRDSELIKETEKVIIDNSNINNIQFDVIQNDSLCEVNAFKKHIIGYKPEYNEIIFFAHTKGLRIFNDYPGWTEYYINWVLCLYFYSLNFTDEVEKKILGGIGGNNSAFYGPIMAFDSKEECKGLFYPGTFYWVNINKIRNDEKNGLITIPNFCYRASVEDFPKIYNDTDITNTSHDNKYMEKAPYYYDVVDYDNLTDYYGNKDEYKSLKDKIINEIRR